MKIYYININELNNEEVYNKYFNEASQYRKDKLRNLKNSNAKKQSLGSEILIKHIAKSENVKSDIIRNKYGKPQFEFDKIFFNISHSGNYVVGVSSEYEVGIDVEKIKDENELSSTEKKIVLKQFTKDEQNYINESLELKQQVQKFYSLWTMKEAYVKMKGMGMKMPFTSFEIKINQEKAYVKYDEISEILQLNFLQHLAVTICHNKKDCKYTIEEIII